MIEPQLYTALFGLGVLGAKLRAGAVTSKATYGSFLESILSNFLWIDDTDDKICVVVMGVKRGKRRVQRARPCCDCLCGRGTRSWAWRALRVTTPQLLSFDTAPQP